MFRYSKLSFRFPVFVFGTPQRTYELYRLWEDITLEHPLRVMLSTSTLRRLAADHAMLHSELPPYYLFDPSSTDSTVDDLTRLTVFMTGPNGTPYSQGLWKLSLKIPDSYPAAPPTATFRTRIWHPNVEENTGNVCVDTLKKDWEPRLTLRDVLIVRALLAFRSMTEDFIANLAPSDCFLSPPTTESRLSS